ncbi:DUF1349 domain-containing protein [Phytomonospora endophytica]|uniref:ABC transporter permease n=1 Tax=Phytomonospora endophytica TaxID=714109 RepID=A0A841G1C1_9ACTN|nr:DUF1349 domain-containing protein [Phytomonospora endophytica]MBB6037960.1 hypothetical protein [Phytomonospora endophytica]GIG68860.1 hypothetical protein Pen01_51550 [Phytomonospora endophytica]
MIASRSGRDGFLPVLRAEWTKFRTVRGWVAAMSAAALMMVLVALLAGMSGGPRNGSPVPIGPGGEAVTDSFYLAHRTLSGDGGITVAVASLETVLPSGPGGMEPGVVPWAKAGIIFKRSTDQGSSYVAIMVTPGHGVRMQYDYTGDIAGPASPTAAPRWLRLERSGDAVTGYASADGTRWTEVATVRPRDLGGTVHGGLFVASPASVDGPGTLPSVSTADFTGLGVHGGWSAADWTGTQIGPDSPTFAGYPPPASGAFTDDGGRLTLTGSGDIAPATREILATGGTLRDILTGTFPALVAVMVVGTLFITTEYRQNLIHVTLTADPGRGRTLAAKAIVLAVAAFATGLTGALAGGLLGTWLAEAGGVYVFPVPLSAALRVALGTAALLAAASVLALAAGAILRRGAAAVTAVFAVVVLPYLLIAVPFTPSAVSNAVARMTPGAAFAVQQTLTPYDQVDSVYTPYTGYYPLEPWAGLAVLAVYAAAGLTAAAVLLRRRDA